MGLKESNTFISVTQSRNLNSKFEKEYVYILQIFQALKFVK